MKTGIPVVLRTTTPYNDDNETLFTDPSLSRFYVNSIRVSKKDFLYISYFSNGRSYHSACSWSKKRKGKTELSIHQFCLTIDQTLLNSPCLSKLGLI